MLLCRVFSPEKQLYQDYVDGLVIPHEKGALCITPQYQSVIMCLSPGFITITKSGEKTLFELSSGIFYKEAHVAKIIIHLVREAQS